MKFGVVFKLSSTLAEAVAVEWTEVGAPLDSGTGWEPCIRLADGSWQLFASDTTSGAGAANPYLRDPGLLRNVGLRYRLEAAGPWSPVSVDRKEITIVDPTVSKPALLSGPALAGTGVIGTEVTVDPGRWDGRPTPAIALQWLRDGAAIAGATAAAYRPVAADDRRQLACAVTASNVAGSERVVTAALAVKYAPPKATGTLAEEVFDEDSGIQTVEAAPAFAGEDLTFTVEGAGATVDPRSGRISIPTDTPVSATVRVTVTNSGGNATLSFPVTVEGEPPLVGPSNAELVLLPDLDPDATGLHLGLKITDSAHPLHPAQGGVGYLAWTGASPVGRNPLTQANKAVRARNFATQGHAHYGVWALTRQASGALASWADRTAEIGGTITLTATWSDSPATVPIEQATWLDWGPTFPAWTLPTLKPDNPDKVESRRMPFQSEAEWIASQKEGYVGGDGMQQRCGLDQCRADPNYLVTVQDVGGAWVSFDGGQGWWKPQSKGLRSRLLNTVGIDAANKLHHAVTCYGAFVGEAEHQGLYVTTDGGQTYAKKLGFSQYDKKFVSMPLIAASPASVSGGRCLRWYGFINRLVADPNNPGEEQFLDVMFCRAANGVDGDWSLVSTLALGTYGVVKHVVCHPGDVNTVFFASTTGIWRATGAGGTPTIARIRSGGYESIGLCELLGGTLQMVVGNGSGIHKTTNAMAAAPSWTQAGSQGCFRLLVSRWNPDHMITWGDSSNPRVRYSSNGGSSFAMAPETAMPVKPGWNRTNGPAQERIAHAVLFPQAGKVYLAGIMKSPNNIDIRSDNANNGSGGTWRLSMDYYSGTHSSVGYSTGQGFSSNRDVFGIGIIDAAVCMTFDRGRSWRRVSLKNEDITRLGIGKRTCAAFAIHPNYGPQNPIILATMDTANDGKFVMCASADIENGSNWVRPSVFPNSKFKSRWMGWDLSDGANGYRYAYAIRHRSTDGGRTWSEMGGMPADYELWGATRAAVGANGCALFAFDMGDTQTKVIRSTDRGNSWTPVLTFQSGQRLLNLPGKSAGGAFLPHPSDMNVLFVQHSDGKQVRRYRLDEGSVTNRPYILINPAPANILAQLASGMEWSMFNFALDHRYPDKVMYATNYTVGSGVPMVRSTDGGATWVNLAGYVPDNSLTFTDVSPTTGDVIQTSTNGAFVIKPPYPQSDTIFDALAQPHRVLAD